MADSLTLGSAAAAQPHASGVSFLGLRFASLTLEQAVAAIAAHADRRAPFGYVATPNVDHCVKLDRERDVRGPLYDDALLVLNDSRILFWLAQRSGFSLPAIPGSDIAAALFEQHIRADEAITIIGADEEVVEALIARYRLTDVRWHAPPMGLRNDPAALDRAAAFIAAQPSRFVFLCVGAPQQEMAARAAMQRGDAVGVGLCCGAALEFLAGRKARAPRWMQKAGLEWLRYLFEGPAIFWIWRRWAAAARQKGVKTD
jgi:exopolysaccharide biosynthesis WecB/TagA/CpsF family protein